eukprot:XP_008680762.1 uncharacterized protein LOC103655861 [Zea mays]
MGSDWHQVMSQYGSFLSQIDEQPMGTQHSEFQVDGQAEGSRTPAVPKKTTQRTKLANFTADEDTRTSLVASRFAAIEKKPFHFLHCWAILKDQPKWMDNHMGQQNQHGNANPTHSNTVDVDAEEFVPSSFTSKRPLGRDSSKEKAKRTKSVDTSSSDSEFMTRMGDLSLERLSVYKTAVTTEEKKLDSMNKNERQKLLLEKKKLNLEKLRL